MPSTELIAAVRALPIPLPALTGWIAEVQNNHAGVELAAVQESQHLLVLTPAGVTARNCGCITCDGAFRSAYSAAVGDPWLAMPRRMIVCGDCGNKRCPHATHHGHACTASNSPGQQGSIYA